MFGGRMGSTFLSTTTTVAVYPGDNIIFRSDIIISVPSEINVGSTARVNVWVQNKGESLSAAHSFLVEREFSQRSSAIFTDLFTQSGDRILARLVNTADFSGVQVNVFAEELFDI